MRFRFAPVLFVGIWSTGFIVARAIAPLADPCLYLTARFATAALILAGLALAARAPWPGLRQCVRHLGVGGLLHGVYLSTSYRAVAMGLPPGIMALIGALQPPLTAVLAGIFLNERAGRRLYGGMVLGMAGVTVVVWPGPAPAGLPPIPAEALGLGFVGMAAITIGTLAQKSILAQADIRVAGALQHAGGVGVTMVLAMLWGEQRFRLTGELLVALLWGAGGLSVGATTLLLRLVRHGEASRAVSLLFLVPPLALGEAWLLFGTGVSLAQLGGFALALAGVALARAHSGKTGGALPLPSRKDVTSRPRIRSRSCRWRP